MDFKKVQEQKRKQAFTRALRRAAQDLIQYKRKLPQNTRERAVCDPELLSNRKE